MGALPVHIAVLTIADDAATADHATAQAIAERAGTAGHVIVDEEIVRDNEAAIHDQLVRWISHDNVDVVIVAASVESESAAAALAPLVVQTLPGFTDLFRWLTFQEIGASAMLSAAEAAQCQGTFVFVLPAHEGAVRAAMDKLILPQLDVRTKPKNLVSQMPRLRDAAKKFVDTSKSQPVSAPVFAPPVIAPQPIPAPPVISAAPPARPDTEPEAVPLHVSPEKEKTQGGPGLQPKLPARNKPRTANTIARRTDDPPTKPIDLAKLEKQIKLSTQNDAQTKVIDLKANDALTKVVDMSAHQAKTRVVDSARVLPRVPPGADESALDDDSEGLTFTAPPRTNTATQALPPMVRSPAPVGVVKPAPVATPARQAGPAPTVPAARQSSPAMAAPARQSTPAPAPTIPASRQALATPPFATPIARSTPGAPPRQSKTPPATPATRDDGKTPPILLTRDEAKTPPLPMKVVAPRPQQATPPPTPAAMRRPAASPPRVVEDEAPTTRADEARTTRVDDAWDTSADEAPTARAASTHEAPSRPTPQPNAAEMWARSIPSSIPSPMPATAAETARAEQAAPVSEAADEPAGPAPISNLFANQPVRRPKTAQPVDPLAAALERPIGVGDLPEGDFVYPIRRSGAGMLLKIVIALAVLGLGFFAFITFYPQDDQPTQAATMTPSEPAPAPVTQPPTPAPVPEPPPAPEPPKAEPAAIAVEPAQEAPPPPTAKATKPPTTKPPTTKPPTTKPPTTKPPAEGATKPPVEPGEPKPKPDPEVVADPGCDEVGCVLSKYDRPCCERFKPADGFTPKNVVPEELDRAMVKAGVEKIKPKVVACGEQNGAKGTVKLAVTVDGEGTVKAVSVTEAPDSALGECVASAMRRAKFGKSVNGAEFSYPFQF